MAWFREHEEKPRSREEQGWSSHLGNSKGWEVGREGRRGGEREREELLRAKGPATV